MHVFDQLTEIYQWQVQDDYFRQFSKDDQKISNSASQSIWSSGQDCPQIKITMIIVSRQVNHCDFTRVLARMKKVSTEKNSSDKNYAVDRFGGS